MDVDAAAEPVELLRSGATHMFGSEIRARWSCATLSPRVAQKLIYYLTNLILGYLCWSHVDIHAGSDCPTTCWWDLW
ncbi:hypothetical protein Q7C36_005949 [Tachysurus vachellii]|uniref:Uncharacterized protein n=1 Tax=Tachysurus vachellii TaxID=175792 RepID=A0AA88NET5_TACVA|nr:hypothetical protein Q7C36_005949 [Tachysurus vachellii]